MLQCEGCPLKGNQSVGPDGDVLSASYILVGEAPGREEVSKGLPFVGPTGRGLMRLLKAMGISREECYLTNAVKCKAPGNKVPAAALTACRPILMAELKKAPASTPILVMGKAARDSLLPALKRQGILASRGWYERAGRHLMVTVHPAYVVLYQPNQVLTFLHDLARLKRGPQPPVVVRKRVLDYAGLFQFAQLVRAGKYDGEMLSFDLETDQVDWQRDRILSIQFCLPNEAVVIVPDKLLYRNGIEWVTTDWDKEDWEDYLSYPPYLRGEMWEPNQDVVRLLLEIFAREEIEWVGHNAHFDLKFLREALGVHTARVDFDTMIAHYALDERRGGHGLKQLADLYYDTGNYEKEVVRYAGKKSGRYSKVPRDVLYHYGAMDVIVSRRLGYEFKKQLMDQGLYINPFLFPLMASVEMLLAMSIKGILIDWKGLAEFDADVLGPEMERVRQQMADFVGRPDLNPNSAQQMITVVYDELKFPIVAVRTRSAGRKVKKRSTMKEVVDAWASQANELGLTPEQITFVQMLKHWRHVAKMRQSYVRVWQKQRGTDDAVHASIWLRGTVTGRLSMRDPALQTIPSDPKDTWGMGVTRAHTARPGWKFVYADYGQMELRIAACISGDPQMILSFNKENPDYHTDVATAAFGPDFEKWQRDFCKRLTFGWLFGGNAYEIARDALQFSEAVARRFSDNWNERFKVMTAYHKMIWRKMQTQGYVESVTGRRRRFHLLTKKNQKDARGAALNMPIQSAASDMTLISAIKLHGKYDGLGFAHVALLIHDALIMEVRDDRVDEVAVDMRQTMIDTAHSYFPQVPFDADTKIGVNLEEVI